MTQLLDTLEFEETGWMTIASFARRAGAGELVLDVRSRGDAFEPQVWRVMCADLRECRVNAGPVDDVEVLDDHVLLAPYRDARIVLGFKGPARDPRHAVADLWERHRAVAEGWVPFGTYFNGGLPLAELLAAGSAILAEGPQRLMAAYAGVLPAHGAEGYVISEREPVRWNGYVWEPERRDVQLLLLSDEAWLIGADFAAERLHPGAVEHGV